MTTATLPTPATLPFPTLLSQRLCLRELVEDDAPALLAIHGDADHMRWFGIDPPRDLDGARARIQTFTEARSLPTPGVRWGLVLRDSGRLVGSCGLFNWNRSWRKCMLGYELAPDLLGRSLMREALQTVLDWAWTEMDLHRVEALVHPDNTRSLGLLRRLGFVAEGLQREVAWWGGQPHDMVQLALLRRDWAA